MADVKLTKAQARCLRSALTGCVFPPATGAYRMRGGEIGRQDGCHSRRVINALTDRGYLRPIDIASRAITDAGRQALGEDHGE